MYFIPQLKHCNESFKIVTASAPEQMVAIVVTTSTPVRTVPTLRIPTTTPWYKKNVFSLVNIVQLSPVV